MLYLITPDSFKKQYQIAYDGYVQSEHKWEGGTMQVLLDQQDLKDEQRFGDFINLFEEHFMLCGAKPGTVRFLLDNTDLRPAEMYVRILFNRATTNEIMEIHFAKQGKQRFSPSHIYEQIPSELEEENFKIQWVCPNGYLLKLDRIEADYPENTAVDNICDTRPKEIRVYFDYA